MPIFISLNIALPLTTRILLTISIFLQKWGLLLIFGVAICIAFLIFIRTRIPRLQYVTDYALLYIPIAGTIARAFNAANFCRTFGLLLNSGVQITEAIQITADTTKNVVYKNIYTKIAEHILRGESISRGIEAHTALFPDMLPHMIVIGERTGSLSETLRYLSELYESEIDEHTKNLSNSIEPILLITMGIIVGLIAVSIISPIYEVTKNLSH